MPTNLLKKAGSKKRRSFSSVHVALTCGGSIAVDELIDLGAVERLRLAGM